MIVGSSASARLADAKVFAQAFDLGHLGEHIQRIERAIDSDPGQAIGSAKELAETVAKTILNKRKIVVSPSADMLELGKLMFKVLKQMPDDIPEKAKGSEIIKRMLSNLSSVVQGIAELRGLYGTGHGRWQSQGAASQTCPLGGWSGGFFSLLLGGDRPGDALVAFGIIVIAALQRTDALALTSGSFGWMRSVCFAPIMVVQPEQRQSRKQT